MDSEVHDHDGGLAEDLPRLLGRRRILGFIAGAGLVTIAAACGGDDSSSSSSVDTTGTTAGGTGSTAASTAATSTSTTSGASSVATSGTCEVVPAETAGPFPGDGSNGKNVLDQSGVVRADIRSSIGSASGVAEGVPMTIKLTVLDSADGCAPLAGAAVYLWHCDRDGNYSMYSSAVASENYLRGVQETDSTGTVTFTSIFPGCYAGRWPHIHYEVYPSVAKATASSSILHTSQIALPEATCAEAYAADGYSKSVTNLKGVSLQRDNVFSDGWELQLASATGSVSSGYTIANTVSI
ncbi:MAG: intradiol ring-cleavage dioxygenase [Acidimicrobiia bacterium]